MSTDSNRERAWYVKFNLKPISFWKKAYGSILYFYGRYLTRTVSFGRKDIEKFIKATGVKINYLYAHKFFATYNPHFGGFLKLELKNFTYEVFLPVPELYQGETELKQKYYYFTLFHELIHWTGCEYHLKRFSLDRPIKTTKLSQASEEVVAAFGCLYLMQKFDMADADVNERIVYYVKDYASSVVFEMSKLKLLELRPNWTLNDYFKNDPVVYNYMLGLMDKAKTAVDYLESLQK